jgi:hypothetical protein
MKKLSLILLISFLISNNYFLYSEDKCFFKTCVVCNEECNESDNKSCFGRTFFSQRPQDSNSARRILELNNISNNKITNKDYRSNVNVALQYQKSFDSGKLAKWFSFTGNDCMTIGIPGDGQSFDINGSQFGMSLGSVDDTIALVPGPIGKICTDPVVKNFIADFDFYFDLSCIKSGLWWRLDVPVVQQTTDLRLRADGSGKNGSEYGNGLFDITCTKTPVPYTNILEAFLGDRGWGSVPALQSGKYKNCKQKKTGIAALHFDLGYDFYLNDCSYFGASIHAVAPTGNAPTAEFVFEPVIGPNRSAQVGFTLEGYRLWECADERALGFYFYGVGTHLFKASQTRLFNLKHNGPGSQYLLLKTINQPTSLVLGADRVANLLAGETKIGADFMFDGSLMFQFSYHKFFMDIGYNFWIRTKEKRGPEVCLRNFAPSTYAIKDDLPLTRIDSFLGCISNIASANDSTIAQSAPPTKAELTIPIFIDPSDINFSSALNPSTHSNKVFASLGYASNIKDHSVYILVEGEAEFGKKDSAINQWGVLGKFGFEF